MRIELVEPLDRGGAFANGFAVVLREVADGDVVAPADRAAIDGELLFFIADEAWRIPNQRFQERGFSGTVAAHQRDFFAAVDIGAEGLEDFHAVVFLHHALDFERMLAGVLVHLKANEGARDIGSGELGGLQAFDFFLARRGLRGTRAG